MQSRAHVCLLPLLPLLTACTIFETVDGDGSPTTPVVEAPPARTEPAAPPLEGTPKPSDLDEKLGVFVVATANDQEADGTRIHPFGTITKAIESAKEHGKRVYVCEGTYREAIAIADGVSMVGGLDCSTATWSLGNARSRIEAPSWPAILAKEITKTTRIERFDVTAPDATQSSESSIGLLAVSANALTVANAILTAGNAHDGDDGRPGVPLVPYEDGRGESGAAEHDSYGWTAPFPGGEGGRGTCSGGKGFDGERGGKGGTGGTWKSEYRHDIMRVGWVLYGPGYAPQAGEAKSGAPGSAGVDGASASTFGSFTRDGFVPAHGTRGTHGGPGKGGSGGTGAEIKFTSADNKTLWWGNAGSGGGAGGCPGRAGEEGKGGGASVAAVVIDSSVTFDHVELVAKNGGNGGKGSFPSQPTAGGAGGIAVNGIPGTEGKPGGRGGFGGNSGSGAGGPSIALACSNARAGEAPKMIDVTSRVGEAGKGVADLRANGAVVAASADGIAKEIYSF